LNITFRYATKDDLEAIVNLCNECFEEKTSLEYAKKIYSQKQDYQIYLIGELNNKIVAHTLITIIPTIFNEMNTYSIVNHFCVKEEYRRLGIATYMLEVATKISKDNGCKTIKLWSKNFRIPAQACYKKYGFLVEDAKFFYKNI
jgi:Acetyltransferases